MSIHIYKYARYIDKDINEERMRLLQVLDSFKDGAESLDTNRHRLCAVV